MCCCGSLCLHVCGCVWLCIVVWFCVVFYVVLWLRCFVDVFGHGLLCSYMCCVSVCCSFVVLVCEYELL